MQGLFRIRGLVALTLAFVLLNSIAWVQAQDSKSWIKSSAFDAIEAVQAAAADEAFFYAVSSTQIARYDRSTGHRVAVSRGDASHLNSAFLLDNQLFCAHSNYPKVPEKSEIRVLDLQSMELKVFKDFGASEGSLTWAVRHDGQWWCNFAHYQAENDRTYLASFDDNWNQTGRWKYPPVVIKQLGQYSLSGGAWQDGCLLVTGHDDPVLFRLRLPSQGQVLEFLDVQSIPFTGQGIALDWKTGGLVGIDRKQRQVVFATAPQATTPMRLRTLSYNIHHAVGTDGVLDLERIAQVIQSNNADIVALQEVDRRVPRSGGVDQPRALAQRLRMSVSFGSNITLEGGDYGNAVLSRFPIRYTRNIRLPRVGSGEQRGALYVEIELPGHRSPLPFIATHFDHRPSDEERFASSQEMNRLVERFPVRPMLLAGDLNDTRSSRTLKMILEHWHDTGGSPTIPVTEPVRQIDFVFCSPKSRWSVMETTVINESVASDHRPILSVLEWLPESGSR